MKNQLPAQAIEIENALLRNLISEGSTGLDLVIRELRPELFYKDENVQVFEIVKNLYNANKTVDLLTVSDVARQANIQLSDYVFELVTATGNDLGFNLNSNRDYVNILQQKYMRRKAIETLMLMDRKLSDAATPDHEGLYIIESAYQQMNEIINGSSAKLKPLSEILPVSINNLQTRIQQRNDGHLPGINTGLSALNSMMAGWQRGELIVLAARPGMGKTALAMHFAMEAARTRNPVLFFSLEMADHKLTDRMIIGESGVNSGSYHHGNINQYDLGELINKAGNLNQLPIFIDEQTGCDIDYIVATARLAVRKNDVKMLIIDYLQLMDMKDRPGQTRDQAIGIVTRKLKQLSKELDIPVILLSQLNRALEARTSKVPTLADLRESGNIEQDADMVLLLFRPAYYDLPEHQGRSSDGVLWIITEKYRSGAAKDIAISHNQNLTKFFDYEKPNADPY